MSTDSLPSSYFEALYGRDPDPWRFASSAYERDKYVATLASLDDRRFARGLEIGCSIGVLTQMLAPRCDRLVAVDVVPSALDQARARCADQPWVNFERMQVPQQWPEGEFDLILLSEVVYYLSRTDVDTLADHVRASLEPDGSALLVHWTGPTNYPLSGDAAADRFIARAGFRVVLQERQPEYRLDLLQPATP